MNKQEFLAQLRKGLAGLPQEEIEERLTFYNEMIDDRMEEGLSEEEAVRSIGPVESIIGQIILERPHATAEPKPKKRLNTWVIVLLLLSAPVWIPLLSAVVSVYVAVWSAIASLWVAFGSLVFSAAATVWESIVLFFGGKTLTALAMLGAGAICAGLSIFLFYGCYAATKGTVHLTKKLVSGIKNYFAKKEGET